MIIIIFMAISMNLCKTMNTMANMADPAGQFSSPLGMGGNWELFGMTIIRKE